MTTSGNIEPDTYREWARLLSAAGPLATELYGLALSAPLHRFQHLALAAVRTVLAFDSATWEFGIAEKTGTRCHSIYRYGEAATGGDHCVRIPACRTPLDEADAPDEWSPDRKPVEEIAFHRAGGPGFCDAERLFVRGLVPQLVDTWRLNRRHTVQGDRRSSAPPVEALAICDGHGWLHATGRQFPALMRTEWPRWHGPSLPPGLLPGLVGGYAGDKVKVTAVAANDLWLLTVRRRTPADRLTPRERDIARCFGRGLGYREVAETLCISPSTARNHLKNIYDKLEINSRAELAGLLRQIERPSPTRERPSVNGP